MHQLEWSLAAVLEILPAVVPPAGAAPEAGKVLVVATLAAGILVVLAAARQLLAEAHWVFLADFIEPAVLFRNNPMILALYYLAQLANLVPFPQHVVLVHQPVIAQHRRPLLPVFGGVLY